MAKILSKNVNYNGISAGVPFAGGKGETDDKHLLTWFRRKGYAVIDDVPAEQRGADGEPHGSDGEPHGSDGKQVNVAGGTHKNKVT